MEYEWDLQKAKLNSAKHGVLFELIKGFDWSSAVIRGDDRREYGESRFTAIGDISGRLHVVVFTIRGKKIRLIGLRKANARERLRYERQEKAKS